MGIHSLWSCSRELRSVVTRELIPRVEVRGFEGWDPDDERRGFVRRVVFSSLSANGVLPSSLTHLTFGTNFNQPLGEGVLPSSLTHLTFGTNFNQPLGEGVLPSSLTQLVFGWFFDQELGEGVLP